MSAWHSGLVWHHSRAEGGTLLVALALADSINHAAGVDYCWPKQDTLARLTRLSKRQVQRAIKDLQDLGELSIEREGRQNRYTLLKATLASSDDILSRDTDVANEATPMSSNKATPMSSSSCIEPEEEPRKEPESVDRVFDAWRSASGNALGRLSPSRRRLIKRVLDEEPDVELVIRCLHGYANHAAAKGKEKWDLSDAFVTFKGRDRVTGQPVFGDLRERINWLLALNPSPNSERSVEDIKRRMQAVGLDPHKGFRWLDEIRYTYTYDSRPERARAEAAIESLRAYGFDVVILEDRPHAKLTW